MGGRGVFQARNNSNFFFKIFFLLSNFFFFTGNAWPFSKYEIKNEHYVSERLNSTKIITVV